MSEKSTVARFDPEQYDDFGYRGIGTMRQDDDYGDWVMYKDYERAAKRIEELGGDIKKCDSWLDVAIEEHSSAVRRIKKLEAERDEAIDAWERERKRGGGGW